MLLLQCRLFESYFSCTLDCCWGKFNRRINWDISTLNFYVFFSSSHLPLFHNGAALECLVTHTRMRECTRAPLKRKCDQRFVLLFFFWFCIQNTCAQMCNSLTNAYINIRNFYFSLCLLLFGSHLNSINNCTQCAHLKRKCNLQILVYGKVPLTSKNK